ncbi:MarR family winged helix-turn-helix transcriptional regulator [uncultured Cellulomonas sp.]|uniref:MarR family winged helix-turn-helix transcriptional regulator n=1 Tax=uncultured Cellulomonas sp. TaxID=189682 RepID=UPI0028E31CCC|nr:MarR family winged helix-turn-helix transcriptional regulator [uncultured Cellulomonas sp.]
MPSTVPDTPPQALLRAIEVFSRTLRESSFGVARDLGCSKGTLSIVRILQRRGALQVNDIAHALRVDISVASRQVSQLVEDGLVERAVDDDDRRARTIRLSPAGRSLAVEIGAALDVRVHELFADWSVHDLSAATATLSRLSDAVTRATAPALASASA